VENPEWLKDRDQVLNAVIARNAASSKALPKEPIVVTLPDGKQVMACPSQIASSCQTAGSCY
jgi:hypothetical protein